MSEKSCVLIVDDEERGRDALEMLFATENYNLAFATQGEEALQLAQALIPDVILLDIMMPGMDGFEVCRHLRSHPKLAEVPVIMITALDDRDSRLRGIEAGADDFLIKPFDRTELRTRVRTITRLNRYHRLLVERMRFEWVVEKSSDGYVLLQGDLIHYANSTARTFLSLGDDDSRKVLFLNWIKKHYRLEPEFAWQTWPHPTKNGALRYLVRSETTRQPQLWLQVDILNTPGDKDNEALVCLQDVSEQINLQRQMWTFQSFISHKLRTPLNGLVSLQFLDNKNMQFNAEQTSNLLNIARESAKRLQDQIVEILRYVDSSQLVKQSDDNFQLSHLPQLVTEISQDLNLTQVDVTIVSNLETCVFAFPGHALELVLRELLINSKKFHPEQSPEISITAVPKEDDFISLSVSDNGQHLSKQELEKVWTPYYQSEKSFTGEIKGMGLGLPMVARLIWGRGGSCCLKNRHNQTGVTVELTLPLITQQKEEASL